MVRIGTPYPCSPDRQVPVGAVAPSPADRVRVAVRAMRGVLAAAATGFERPHAAPAPQPRPGSR